MHAMLLQAAADAAEPGLTLKSILADLPHDAASIVVYILTAVAVGWVIVAGRRKGTRPPAGEPNA